MLCEVCGRPAVDRSPPGYGGVKINCPTCGNYSIAGSVRDKFRQLSLDERRRDLERAKDHASLVMRNERASQPGAALPKYRCLAEPTIDEASLSAAVPLDDTYGVPSVGADIPIGKTPLQ